MKSFAFLIYFQLASIASTELLFDVNSAQDGTFIPLLKEKNIGSKRGEDSFSTTPKRITVGDGVGGYDFSSSFISGFLTTSAALNSLLFHFSPEMDANQIAKSLKQAILDEIEFYDMLLNNYFKLADPVFSKEMAELAPVSRLNSATTLASITIVKQLSEKSVKTVVLQKGDSLVTVFRRQPIYEGKSANLKGFIYLPVLVTNDQQQEFNSPDQFVNVDTKYKTSENDQFEFDLFENDIVLVGSDGLFDNDSLSFLTFCLNLAIERMIEPSPLNVSPIEMLYDAADAYIAKLNSDRAVIDNYFLYGDEPDRLKKFSNAFLLNFVPKYRYYSVIGEKKTSSNQEPNRKNSVHEKLEKSDVKTSPQVNVYADTPKKVDNFVKDTRSPEVRIDQDSTSSRLKDKREPSISRESRLKNQILETEPHYSPETKSGPPTKSSLGQSKDKYESSNAKDHFDKHNPSPHKPAAEIKTSQQSPTINSNSSKKFQKDDSAINKQNWNAESQRNRAQSTEPLSTSRVGGPAKSLYKEKNSDETKNNLINQIIAKELESARRYETPKKFSDPYKPAEKRPSSPYYPHNLNPFDPFGIPFHKIESISSSQQSSYDRVRVANLMAGGGIFDHYSQSRQISNSHHPLYGLRYRILAGGKLPDNKEPLEEKKETNQPSSSIPTNMENANRQIQEQINHEAQEVIKEKVKKTQERPPVEHREFFASESIDLLNQPLKPFLRSDILNSNALKALKKSFFFTQAQIETIDSEFDGRLLSDALAGVTHFIATYRGYYPSPFYLKSLKMIGPCKDYTPIAKNDDITAAVVRVRNSIFDEKKQDRFNTEIKKIRTTLSLDLKTAVSSFKKYLLILIQKKLQKGVLI